MIFADNSPKAGWIGKSFLVLLGCPSGRCYLGTTLDQGYISEPFQRHVLLLLLLFLSTEVLHPGARCTFISAFFPLSFIGDTSRVFCVPLNNQKLLAAYTATAFWFQMYLYLGPFNFPLSFAEKASGVFRGSFKRSIRCSASRSAGNMQDIRDRRDLRSTLSPPH